jgi:hypothetical protein
VEVEFQFRRVKVEFQFRRVKVEFQFRRVKVEFQLRRATQRRLNSPLPLCGRGAGERVSN